MKIIYFGKEEVKLFLFTDDIILYIENPKESSKEKTKEKPLLELLSEFSEVTGHMVKNTRNRVFLSASSERSEKENDFSVPFTTASMVMAWKV